MVLALIRDEPGLTDRQIRERLGTKYVAYVNQICHSLEAGGLIRRIPGPHGPLVNVPSSASPKSPIGAKENGRSAPPSGAPTVADGPAGADAWQCLRRLDLRHTLLIIPCSAAKRPGGAVEAGPQLASMLPREVAQRLGTAQAAAAPKAVLDTSKMLPAWRRYRGAFYRAADPALEIAMHEQSPVLILSGGYGVVLARQPIGRYNAMLRPGWWADHLLQQCLVAYAQQHGLTAVVGFAGRRTPYAHIVRSAAWGANGAVPVPPVSGIRREGRCYGDRSRRPR